MSVSPFEVPAPVEEVEEVEPVFEEPAVKDVPSWVPQVIVSADESADEPGVEPDVEDLDEGEYEIEAEATGALSGVAEDIAGVSVAEFSAPLTFEGHDVASTELQVALKLDDLPRVTIDDRVHIVATVHVRDVLHKTDGNGDIARIVKAKQVDASVEPFVAGEDDGVIRRA